MIMSVAFALAGFGLVFLGLVAVMEGRAYGVRHAVGGLLMVVYGLAFLFIFILSGAYV